MKRIFHCLAPMMLFGMFLFCLPANAELPEDVVQMKPFESRLPVPIDDWKVASGDHPGAEAVGYDDSSWRDAKLGFTWEGRNTIYWFRKKMILPKEISGMPVFLHVAVNDGGTAFVDGKNTGRFSNSIRVRLVSEAKSYQEVTIAIRAENAGGSGAFTFAGYETLFSPNLVKVEKTVHLLKGLGQINYVDITGWKFSDKPGKKPSSPEKDDSGWTPVRLSHRWKGGKSSGWYRTVFEMPETVNGFPFTGGEIELEFEVEDTADVYVNGRRVKNIKRGGALDATGKIEPGESIQLAVKVTSLTGEGRFRRARLHASALDGLQQSVVSLLGQFDVARLLFSQHPEPPRAAVDAVSAASHIVGEAVKIKEPERFGAMLESAVAAMLPVSDLLVDFPVFTMGPYLQNVRKDAITIMWETLVPTESTIHYGKGGLSHVVHDPEPKTIHEVTIDGLEEETVYKYVAASGRLAAPESTFRTAIRRDTPFRFAAWGDNRTDPNSHESVIDRMLLSEPDIALNVGDVVTTGVNYSEWGSEYFLPMRRLGIDTPTYIAIGNHEYGGYGCGNPVVWFEKFVSHPAPNDYYFAFTYGNSRFIVLNPQEEAACHDVAPGTEQYEWLINELESEEYKNAAFRFVFFHEPPFSECWSGGYYDGEARLRKNLVPLFEKYDMDIVFSGHTHDYERGRWPKADGPFYIITGGGGASLDDKKYKEWEQIDVYRFVYHFVLVSIDGPRLTFEAIDRDGNVFDGFEVVK